MEPGETSLEGAKRELRVSSHYIMHSLACSHSGYRKRRVSTRLLSTQVPWYSLQWELRMHSTLNTTALTPIRACRPSKIAIFHPNCFISYGMRSVQDGRNASCLVFNVTVGCSYCRQPTFRGRRWATPWYSLRANVARRRALVSALICPSTLYRAC